jgi:hypothetical protein
MARKKAEEPEMPAPATKPLLRLVRLELPGDYHRDLRVIAAKQETTMAILARKLISEYVDQQRKAGKV